MKKNIFTAAAFAFLSLAFVNTGCEQLQGTLSSTLNDKLQEETGSASIVSYNWYYNGTSSEDMTDYAEKLGAEYYDQSLLVSFGKKVALSTLAGSITVSYSGEDGNTASKTFSSISGKFTDDYTGYKIDMSDVLKLFDGSTIPTGTASMSVKIGGFKCAEGDQSGRSISTAEFDNIKIKPLFESKSVDFSTIGFNSNSKINVSLNGNVSIDGDSYEVTAKDSSSNAYKFSVSADENNIVLTPEFTTAPDDGEELSLSLRNILPENSGDAVSQDITITFTRYAIVIDGSKDANFEAANGATVVSDASSDQDALNDKEWSVTGKTDIQEVSITNDEDYLYIAVSGDLPITWKDSIVILISNGSVTGGTGARSAVPGADTEDFAAKTSRGAKVQPNVYITHQPGMNDDGNGAISAYAYIDSTNTDISAGMKYSPEGWTKTTTGDYIEYAVPLGSVSGINAGDELSIIVAGSLVWSPSVIVDACPDSAVTYNNNDHSDVTYKFADGIEYTVASF